MDDVTRKVVDGTAWREFCDLLADAGEAILAEGNPDDPLDRAEGFRMLTRLLRGSLETLSRIRPAGAPAADLHVPRDDQDRRGEPGQPLPRRVARREVRLPDLGHPRRRQVVQLQPVLRWRIRRRRAGHRSHDARGADADRARRLLRAGHLASASMPGTGCGRRPTPDPWRSARPSSTSTNNSTRSCTSSASATAGSPAPLSPEDLYHALLIVPATT